MDVEELRAATVRRIVGPTILLGSGTYFDFEDPDSSQATPEDIAYGLAYAGRFAGQCVAGGRRVFYSVAEHCVRMAQAVPYHLAYAALMHELGEAVCGDMTGPLKAICPDYKLVEKRAAAALERRFMVPQVDQIELKRWDVRMLATEKRDLMPAAGHRWPLTEGIEPLLDVIQPWSPDKAARTFLTVYDEFRPAGSLRPE